MATTAQHLYLVTWQQYNKERMMAQGIKETQELVQALGTIAIVLGPHVRGGVNLGKDLPAIFLDIQAKPEVIEEVKEAVKDIKLVGVELKDLSFAEVIALAIPFAQRLPEIIKAFSEPEA